MKKSTDNNFSLSTQPTKGVDLNDIPNSIVLKVQQDVNAGKTITLHLFENGVFFKKIFITPKMYSGLFSYLAGKRMNMLISKRFITREVYLHDAIMLLELIMNLEFDHNGVDEFVQKAAGKVRASE